MFYEHIALALLAQKIGALVVALGKFGFEVALLCALLIAEFLLFLVLQEGVETRKLVFEALDFFVHRAYLLATLPLNIAQNLSHKGVVAVDGNGLAVGHLGIELTHTATAHLSHLLHTAHKLIASDGHGVLVRAHSLEGDVVVDFLLLGQLTLKYGAE